VVDVVELVLVVEVVLVVELLVVVVVDVVVVDVGGVVVAGEEPSLLSTGSCCWMKGSFVWKLE